RVIAGSLVCSALKREPSRADAPAFASARSAKPLRSPTRLPRQCASSPCRTPRIRSEYPRDGLLRMCVLGRPSVDYSRDIERQEVRSGGVPSLGCPLGARVIPLSKLDQGACA